MPETSPHLRRSTSTARSTGRRSIGRRLGTLAAGAMLLAAPVLVSCGDDDDSGDGATADSTSPVGQEAGTDATETTGGDVATVEDDETIEIRAADGSFEPATVSVDAGTTVTIDFENEGSSAHTFTIEELDVDEEVQPGETTTVDVQIPDEEGPIEFVCRFHESQGMTGTFQVTASGVDGNTTTTALTDGPGQPGGGSAPQGDTVPGGSAPGGAGGSGSSGSGSGNSGNSAGGVGSDGT